MAGGSDPDRWSDLRARLGSGAIMVGIGGLAVLAGGVWFQMLAVFATSVMVWELWTMIHRDRPTIGMLLAALVASVLSGFLTVDRSYFLVFLLIAPLIGGFVARRERVTFAAFALAIQIAGWGLVVFRGDYGVTWLFWLIVVVVVTDIAGYFAGKTFGGPKFWPKVSPKKTWSGTVAGWLAAGVVGIVFILLTPAGWWLVPVSMLLSFAGQMGDIAESALKRRMKVKDSSTLIPGHGGLFDRFDALLGASLFMLVAAVLFDLPRVAF
ncbi:phosphatidate cytidylyltransferase [Oceanicola granulosus HTCC2516]|uniref:Phosphatidate cytidylyltransferase n=1 Tax=Oceanicola granulosus (strain ATCC BAA-861 / DSM 15982 / KCTC 12143 / HTCC2516) TaxID=314256 RepID=Q2CHX9_OCEGH|nr:phosphatidate cytidylyltransferase [Oceanicola granulosus]EAR52165.1 phosphatidate cytidylyltransferase [Oceanicola granulosus HTCC2516]